MGFLTNNDLSAAWTVSELTGYIKGLIDTDYRLQDIEVEGEISNFVQARSGHLYFTLKDENAQLKCVMWRSSAQQLATIPRDGDAVLTHGRLSVYEAGGVYQLYADWLQPAGRGNLAIAFELLKEQLTSEGLFDASHKRPIPILPKRIGIVTSADAAALRDILNVLQRRYPFVSVLIAPTLVQGEQAPPQIVRALNWLDGRNDIDTIILARGGGSMEDLWAFNDERVARAIFAAQHPVICGVGHETDFTIADFVSDLRAPTPSAAAELAVPDLADYPAVLGQLKSHLTTEYLRIIQTKKWQLRSESQSLTYLNPGKKIDNNRQRLDSLQIKLEKIIQLRLEQLHSRIAVTQAGLAAISPVATLSRGFALVRNENGNIIRRQDQVSQGDKLKIQVSDGEFSATAT